MHLLNKPSLTPGGSLGWVSWLAQGGGQGGWLLAARETGSEDMLAREVCVRTRNREGGKEEQTADHARPGSPYITFHPLPSLPKTLLFTRWSTQTVIFRAFKLLTLGWLIRPRTKDGDQQM